MAGPVLVTTKSACALTAVETVALLLPGVGSLTPTGGVIEAELTIAALAPAATVPVTLKFKLPPAGINGNVADTALPDTPTTAGHVAPPVALTQLAPTPVMAIGTLSSKLAPVTALGPLFVTVNV